MQSGPREITETSMGMNYRALNDLFSIVENRRENFTYEISVQMIEIYNEQVRDLLSKNALTQKYPSLAFYCDLGSFYLVESLE
jgi:kinesin family member C2/C3